MVQYPLPVEHYTPTLRQTPSYVTAPRYRSPTRVVVALLLVTTMLWGCAGQEPLYPDATVLPSRGASQDSTAGVVTGPAQDKDARPGALGEGERSAEIDLYQGALLLSQGMIQEAWHLWATVAKGSHGSAKSVQVDTAWRLLFESYFKHGNPDNTPRFLRIGIATSCPTGNSHYRCHLELSFAMLSQRRMMNLNNVVRCSF